jgi:RNA 3'-terminal phosphate cyclase-like protein
MSNSLTNLEYEGSNFMRLRLILATLSGKSLKITKIRAKDTSPGLKEYEASLIRLFDKITNGSKIQVSETGTTLSYTPGLLTGGKIDHDCCLERGVGYYLEALMSLAPFCKAPLNVTLRGVTNNEIDPSPDFLKQTALPVLLKFILVDEGLEIKVDKRGCLPAGGGQVRFLCPVRKALRPLQWLDQGKIKRIRGVAWATRVSPSVPNRMIEAAKALLLKFIPDVYIYSDHSTGGKSGKSPGFGLVLTAETISGTFLSAEVISKPKEATVPEDLGTEAVHKLLEEIYRGGCVDSSAQSMTLLMMALGPRDVSKLVSGPLSNHTVHFLRQLKDAFQVVFKLETLEEQPEDEELNMGADKVKLTCVGVGFTNLSKRTT